jgi:predicted anti-sigma-YlaC factor YlaD
MSDDFGSAPHLTSEELAAYLDSRLEATPRARIERHLADCAECRTELVEARSLLDSANIRSARSRSVRAPHPAAWLAAAGIVAIAFLPLVRQVVRSRDVSSSERATRPAQAAIEVVSPPNQRVDVAAAVFAWRPVAGASTYRLTVTDSSGTPLLTVVTSDTVHIGSDIALHRGGSYLWYVDGLTSDGRAITSGIQSFSTTR